MRSMRKLIEYSKAPRCPHCDFPLILETFDYSDRQKAEMKCNHIWKDISREDYKTPWNSVIKNYKIIKKCEKCGKEVVVLNGEWLLGTYIPTIPVYRCPNCLRLFREIEE